MLAAAAALWLTAGLAPAAPAEMVTTILDRATVNVSDVANFAWSPDGTRIAYIGDFEEDGRGTLFIASRDAGGTPIRFGAEMGLDVDESSLAFSGDSRWIVVEANCGEGGRQSLCALPSDGSAPPRRIERPPTLPWSPVISPSGARLAYADRNVLYGIDLDGGRPAAVLYENLNSARIGTVFFAPDGHSVIFAGYVAGSNPASYMVYRARVDGSVPPEPLFPSPIEFGTTPISYIPRNGRRLFVKAYPRMYTMRLDRPDALRLTEADPSLVLPGGDDAMLVNNDSLWRHSIAGVYPDQELDRWPSAPDFQEARLTPDGSRIIYRRGDGVASMPVAGGPHAAIYQGNARVRFVTPDSQFVVFEDRAGPPFYFAAPLDGRAPAWPLDADAWEPGTQFKQLQHTQMSPDSQYLVLSARQGGQRAVYRIAVDGSGVLKLHDATGRNADRSGFAVSPDGADLLVEDDTAVPHAFNLLRVPTAGIRPAVQYGEAALTHAGSVHVVSTAQGSPWVLYSAERDIEDARYLYSVRVDGAGGPRPLCPEGTTLYRFWRRVGDQAIFTGQTARDVATLFRAPVDGSGPALAANITFEPEYYALQMGSTSSDGHFIALTDYVGTPAVLDVDTMTVHALTDLRHSLAHGFATPGNALVFVRDSRVYAWPHPYDTPPVELTPPDGSLAGPLYIAPFGDRVAFFVASGGRTRIDLVRAGPEPERVSLGAYTDIGPVAPTPQGELLYYADGGIHLLPLDGSWPPAFLTPAHSEPVLDADRRGRRIVYDTGNGLFSLRRGGGIPARLSPDLSPGLSVGAWSITPDSARVVYQTGYPRREWGGPNDEWEWVPGTSLYTAPLSGRGEIVRLFEAGPTLRIDAVAIRGDGGAVAFGQKWAMLGVASTGIFVTSIHGGTPARLTDSDSTGGFDFKWLGRSLVYTTYNSEFGALCVAAEAYSPPAFAVQPAPVRVAAGGAASFVAEATGAAPLRHRWEFLPAGASVPRYIPLRDGAAVSGSATALLTIDPVTGARGGLYRCVASNADGVTRSRPAALQIEAAVAAARPAR